MLGFGQRARGGKVGLQRISWAWAALGLAGLDWTGLDPGSAGWLANSWTVACRREAVKSMTLLFFPDLFGLGGKRCAGRFAHKEVEKVAGCK